jgi:hypothetical protein
VGHNRFSTLQEEAMSNSEKTPAAPQGAQNPVAQGGEDSRSENLLPADDAGDGRFDVAEEVNLDQQSDATRRVGQTPEGVATDGLAESLKP